MEIIVEYPEIALLLSANHGSRIFNQHFAHLCAVFFSARDELRLVWWPRWISFFQIQTGWMTSRQPNPPQWQTQDLTSFCSMFAIHDLFVFVNCVCIATALESHCDRILVVVTTFVFTPIWRWIGVKHGDESMHIKLDIRIHQNTSSAPFQKREIQNPCIISEHSTSMYDMLCITFMHCVPNNASCSN